MLPAFSKVDLNGDELRHVFKMPTKYTTILIIPVTRIVAILSKDIVYTSMVPAMVQPHSSSTLV
jgi:hypothetical protein